MKNNILALTCIISLVIFIFCLWYMLWSKAGQVYLMDNVYLMFIYIGSAISFIISISNFENENI